MKRLLGLLALAVLGTVGRAAETVAVAAASNLVYVLDDLHAEFQRTEPAVRLTKAAGSSGSLFAQIKHGAPFDVFLSADTEYPRQIVASGLGEAKSQRTFATGQLVLWTMRSDLDVDDIAAAVRHPSVKKIAIAQPQTAPYGRAAQAALEQLGGWADAQRKLVVGENITQTAQFVETGNADAGFVAQSLVASPRLATKGRWHAVPASLHAGVSLDHAAVLTTRGATNAAARRYLDFLATPAAKKILRAHGYGVPP
ncbi:MAG TPA: molybdate ABC transporter substrate-binding protein [Opitutaceae bacterium]|nr:molybdate ABC transporter substrate-binding protein [Opitutaceae bacterium]